MSTRRERLEGRAARRRDWAGSRAGKAAAAHRASDEAVEGLPVGEPRHPGPSGRALARLRERSQDAMSAAVEHERMAEVHSGKAETIERHLRESIYDDDPDALERLEEKLGELEQRRAEMNAANRAFRGEHREELKALGELARDDALPHPKYELTNLSGSITRTRKRITRLQRERDEGVPDHLIVATFDSDCARCAAPLEEGQQIRYNRTDGARCVTCPADA
jgi:Domain of unknown function (DUF3560)